MELILIATIQLFAVALLAPLAMGIVKKCKAFFQGREGASILLPYATLLTLWRKETLVSTTASYIYNMVPVVVFSSALALAFAIPLISSDAPIPGISSFFVLAGVFMLSSVFMVLGGLDTGGVFGGMASSREMTIASLVEPAVLLTFGAIALQTQGGTDAIAYTGLSVLHSPALLLAAVALIFVALAENARFPVDNPATHLELTMVHEGMILEYSGRQLALFEWASAIKLSIFALIIANIFFPAPLLALPIVSSMLIPTLLVTVAKIAIVMFLLALLESTIAKMRFYRMQEYLGVAGVLGFTALLLTILS